MATAKQNNSDPYLNMEQVVNESGLSRTSIYREITRGEFPPGAMISRNRRGWRQSDISNWKEARDAGMSWKEWKAGDKHEGGEL